MPHTTSRPSNPIMLSSASTPQAAHSAFDVHDPDALFDIAIDAPNGSASGPVSYDAAKESIFEGKEKAKAVMAAAGVLLESAEHDGHLRQSSTANVATVSRKRSRSGSIKPAPSYTPDAAPLDRRRVREYLVEDYVQRDLLHAAAMNDQANETRDVFRGLNEELRFYRHLHQQRSIDPVATASRVFGPGYDGFGNGRTEGKTWVMYPHDRKRAGHRRARELRVSRKNATQQADQLDELVPVRLDIELDKLKLRDTFTWNLHDRVVAPELFAETLVEDFQVPHDIAPFVIEQVNREIRDQIRDFYPHVFIEEDALDAHLPYSAYKNDEMRILVKLNITIGAHTLVDQFEWEINNPLNNAEEFARQMALDMSLSGEFTTAIAHSIREQCQMFTRSLYIAGHPFDGRPIEDADVRDGFLQSPLPAAFRPQQMAKDYAPYLYELNDADLQREELSMLREQRRQKRSVTRRGGPALPDLKDRARTVRTMLVSSVLPGAADTLELSRLFKLSRTSGRGRRATRDGDDSDDSESDDSAPESPAPNVMLTGAPAGTSRQRAMRGAATAAQQAMRLNLGRSATPEIAALQAQQAQQQQQQSAQSAHHHETRTSLRRLGTLGTPSREESAGPASLVVKLKIARDRLRRHVLNLGKRRSGAVPPGEVASPPVAKAAAAGILAAGSAVPAPGTKSANSTPGNAAAGTTANPAKKEAAGRGPAMGVAGLPDGDESGGIKYYADGMADAPFPQPMPPHESIPPPPWLVAALASLHAQYPPENFEASMRWTLFDTVESKPVKLEASLTEPPVGVKPMWLPKIRCLDCPGKVYNVGPGKTVDNFRQHLSVRQHRGNVERRVDRERRVQRERERERGAEAG